MSSKSNNAYLGGPLVWTITGSDTPVTLPGDGILQLNMMDPGSIVLENGSVLKGIHLVWGDGEDASFSNNQDVLITLRAEEGGSFTAVHEDAGVAIEQDRIFCTWGANAIIGPNKIQCWWQHDNGIWRWRIPDWSSSASSIPYTPADGTDWVNPDPTNVQDAIDRIAARITTLALGLGIPIP